MSKYWNTGIICLIFKKENRVECANYREIMLISVPYKMLSIMLQKRLETYSEEILNDYQYQCGFCSGKGTTDQIFVVRQIMEKRLEFNTDIHLLFIDYRQAFDSLSREAMSIALVKNGVLDKIVKSLIFMTLKNATAKVKIGGSMSDSFNIVSGVRQDALSVTLFVVHEAVKDTIKKR